MEKIIKRTISLTTKKRDSRNKLFEEFYSHDKNNAIFEFTVEGGVPTENIVVLFHFKRTNRHLEVRGRVDNDKIIVNFDTRLIIKDEQVAGYIYYENGDKSNDVYRFMFDVHVSEIDKEHDLPVMEQESKRIVPLTDIVTKSEITELLKKIVANEKLYDDAEIRGQIATKADTQTVEAIAQRVQTLENKTDNDTVYNDTELRQAIENKAEKEALLQFSTKNELKEVSDKVHELENRPQVDISGLATKQEVEAIPKVNVDSLVTKEELAQKGYLTAHQDISNLVTNDELEAKHYLIEHQSLDGLVTKSELEQKGYLTAHQSLEDYSKKAELDRVAERVQSLEARPQVDTSKLVSKEELEQKNYLTTHQSLENVVTKQELEAKGYLTNHQDLSEYAKKAEIPTQFDSSALTERINALENKAISNGAYNDKPLLDKIHEVQESLKGFITQSSRYLTEHQSLAHLVTKEELASKGYITNHQSLEHLVTKEELEQKGYLKVHQSLENLVTKDELNSKGYLTAHQDISNLATNAKVEAVETRVQTLENKPPVDLSHLATKQELEEVRGSQPSIDNHNFATKEELEAVRNSQPKVDTSNLVTKQELEDKHYIQEHQSLANLVTKDELESKGYLNAHQSLEDYAKKSEIPHIDTTSFATKEELSVVKQKQDTINAEAYVTKDELAQKGYLTAHQDISNLVTKQELHEATEIDYSQIVTHEELENKHYLTTHQSLAEYAKKMEIPNIDTSSFVTKQELESKQYLTNHQSLDGYVKKSELPPQADTSTLVSKQELTNMHLVNAEELGNVSKKMLEQTTKITALESKAEFEIHGTGMPNGTVSAPIGTTYVDTAVTNGALKWIKQSGTGNTGWKVLIGDTGWRTLNSVSRAGNSFIKIRRVNNLVTYQFGGLQWGWFGVGRRNGPGFVRHNSSGDKGAKLTYPNGIPEGFRSENSLVGPTYDDKGRPYGIWYLGGKSDLNFIQFTFNENIPTDRDIGDIRVSAISYVTDEDWPTRLP